MVNGEQFAFQFVFFWGVFQLFKIVLFQIYQVNQKMAGT